jgi:hypothetical protein
MHIGHLKHLFALLYEQFLVRPGVFAFSTLLIFQMERKRPDSCEESGRFLC